MARLRYLSNARTGDAGTVCEGDLTITGDIVVEGSYTYGSGSLPINQNLQGTFTVGQDDTGYDVKFYGAGSGYYWLWDESANGVVLVGTTSHTGALTMATTNYIYFYDSGAAIRASAQNTLALTGTTINLTATTINLSGALTSTGKHVISPGGTGSYIDFALEDEWKAGTLINADYASATTLNGDVIGVFMDFNTNVTPYTDCDITGYKVEFAGHTEAANVTTNFIGFDLPTADALIANSATAVINWKGVNLQLPNITETSGTMNSYGVYMAGGTYTSGQEYGIYITDVEDGLTIAGASTGNAISILQTGNSDTTGYAIRIGLTGTHLTTSTAGAAPIKIYCDSTAATGDNRGIYNRLYFKGSGTGGESLRSYTEITGAYTIGTAHGAHLSLGMGESTTVGVVSGLGAAVRCTLGIPNGTLTGGTYTALMPEIYSFGSSSDATVTELSFIRIVNGGDSTGRGKIDDDAFLFVLDGFTAGSESVLYGNTLKMKVGTTTYYLPMSTAQATFTTAYPIVSTYAGTVFTSTSTITSTDHIMHLTVNDNSTISTGRNSGLYVEYVVGGAKTGGECNPVSVRGTITDSVGSFYAYHALCNITSGKNFNGGLFYGYMSDVGSGTIGSAWAMKLDRVTTTQAADRDMFIGLKAHGGSGRAKTLFYIEGTSSKIAEQFIMCSGAGESTGDWFELGIDVGTGYTAAGALRVGKEAVIGGGVTTQYYIPFYTKDA